MRLIDGNKIVMSLTNWWYSSFGQEETDKSKAIKKVMEQVEKMVMEMHEIVHCKDCSHNKNCDIQYHAQAGDMFFCAGGDGVKKVTSKLNNPDDSLLTEDSEGVKEQESKLDTDLISRQAAIEALMAHFVPQTYTGEQVEQAEKLAQKIINAVPSVEPKPVCEDMRGDKE